MDDRYPLVLLDWAEDGVVPQGYAVIDSEVDFLTIATSGQPFLVRGRRLCEWAQRFCKSRELPCSNTVSPVQMLLELCPKLRPEQASELVKRLREAGYEPEPDWDIRHVLHRLFHDGRWFEEPSVEHAAWYLSWLIEKKLDECVVPLVAAQAALWELSAPPSVKPIYRATNFESAIALMDEWLRLGPKKELLEALPPFPLPLPFTAKERVARKTRELLVENDEGALGAIQRPEVCKEAKDIIAKELASYYEHYPSRLSRQKLAVLAPFLDPPTLARLETIVPPPPPEPLDPKSPVAEVLRWAAKSYMPFRRWAVKFGRPEDGQEGEGFAQQFISWLLGFYPRALQGNEDVSRFLVFARTRELRDLSSVTLFVVLDGLGWMDAETLHRRLIDTDPGLRVLDPEPVISPLPTVTLLAKPAILYGVAPRFAHEGQRNLEPVGALLPEGNIPLERLKAAKAGDVFIWRVNEPDKTYHERYDSKTIERDVQAELAHLADKMLEALNAIPQGLPKRLVITSDHGRLFGPSDRKLDVPPGMESHGRAAWGPCQLHFSGTGFYVAEDQGLYYLHPERFGLPFPVAVPRTTDTFLSAGGKRGAEGFTHGGLYPEEVVVPWLVYVKEAPPPNVECKALVTGVAGREGQLILEIANRESNPLLAGSLELQLEGELWRSLKVGLEVKPLSKGEVPLILAKLPSKAQWLGATAVLRVEFQGVTWTIDVHIVDHTRELYIKRGLEELK